MSMESNNSVIQEQACTSEHAFTPGQARQTAPYMYKRNVQMKKTKGGAEMTKEEREKILDDLLNKRHIVYERLAEM